VIPLLLKVIASRLKAKAIAGTKSATVGVVAGVFIPAAIWVQSHPQLAADIFGQGWGPVVVAGAGLLVLIARARTL